MALNHAKSGQGIFANFEDKLSTDGFAAAMIVGRTGNIKHGSRKP